MYYYYVLLGCINNLWSHQNIWELTYTFKLIISIVLSFQLFQWLLISTNTFHGKVIEYRFVIIEVAFQKRKLEVML